MIDVKEILSQLSKYLNNEQSFDQYYFKNAVIAGGAVCNSVYNHMHNEKAPINDIDIFVFKQLPKAQENLDQDGAQDTYVNEIIGEVSNKVKMVSTERFDNINLTTVSVENLFDLETLGRQLIEGFDINCTKAFITLEPNSKLILHEEFSLFLKTKQLRSYKTRTPIKTMLRIVKKKKEFKAYLSDFHLDSLYEISQRRKTVIVEDTFLKYPTELELLSKYFRFFKMSNGRYKAKYLKPFTDLHISEKLVMRNLELRSRMVIVFDWYFSKNKIYNKYLKLRSYKKCLKAFLANDLESKLKDDFHKDDLVYIEKILAQVRNTAVYFNQMSLAKSITKAKEIHSFRRDEEIYLAFLGLLRFEDKDSDLREEYKSFKKTFINNAAPLTKPLELSESFNGKVFELTSQLALAEEGRKMSHCVGGFADAVKAGNCRIFSIISDAGRSTIEITFNPVIRGVQHQATGNTFPPKENRVIANELINYLKENQSPSVQVSSSNLIINF